MEIVSDFILGGSKIIADGDCSHEIKRCLLLGKKLYWVKFGKHCIKTLIEILSRLWGDIGFSFLQFLKKIFQLFYYKHVFLASLTQWTWVGVNSGRQWRTGKPDVLPSMGSQGAGHDWATEQQQHFVMIHTIKGFSIVNETELYIFFLELWLHWLINLNYNLLEFHIISLPLMHNHPTSCWRSLFRSLGEYICIS